MEISVPCCRCQAGGAMHLKSWVGSRPSCLPSVFNGHRCPATTTDSYGSKIQRISANIVEYRRPILENRQIRRGKPESAGGFFSPPRRRRFFLNTAAAAACLPVRSRRIRTRLAFPLPEFVHERSGGAQPQPRRSCHKLCHAPRLPFNSRARIRHSSRDRRGYCWYLLPLLLPSAAVVDEESKYTTHSHGTCTCIVSSAGRTSYYTATLLIHYWLLLR
jgi:hypothetical protein